MALGPKLQGRLQQRQMLLPEIQLGMKLLGMPLPELDRTLRETAELNPFLRYSPPAVGIGDYDLSRIAEEPTLAGHLREQLVLQGLPTDVRQLAEALIGDLDDDGYLSSSDAELSAALETPVPDIRRAIEALQSCEPAGVASRSLEECIALQLCERGCPPDRARQIGDNLDRLLEHRWTKLKHLLRLDDAELLALADLVRSLSPTPAAGLGRDTQVMVPEFQVAMDRRGNFQVTALLENSFSISLDDSLLNHVDGTHDQLGPLKQAALALKRGLDFRWSNSLRVVGALVTYQQAYFARGIEHMLPLTRRALAESLGLHPATVGRSVYEKALSFEDRVVPLSAFFSNAIGKNHAAFFVQQRIRRLIAAESSNNALSDSQIAALLRSEGVDIARRTVAKYRGCMSIPSSHERMRRSVFRRRGV